MTDKDAPVHLRIVWPEEDSVETRARAGWVDPKQKEPVYGLVFEDLGSGASDVVHRRLVGHIVRRHMEE